MPVLKTGSSGPDVLTLQSTLKQLGFDPNGVDGVFGPGTEAALRMGWLDQTPWRRCKRVLLLRALVSAARPVVLLSFPVSFARYAVVAKLWPEKTVLSVTLDQPSITKREMVQIPRWLQPV